MESLRSASDLFNPGEAKEDSFSASFDVLRDLFLIFGVVFSLSFGELSAFGVDRNRFNSFSLGFFFDGVSSSIYSSSLSSLTANKLNFKSKK